MSTDSMVKIIDIGLSRYYQHLYKPYDEIFLKYCEENGLTDDEAIEDELEADADDTWLTDFDDNFPFTKPSPQSDIEKKEFILNLVKKCVDDPDIEFGDESESIAPTEKLSVIDETKTQIKIAEKLLTKHCSGLFTTELQKDADDKAYKTIKAIDIMTKRPIMLFFVDSYCRTRMDKYIYQHKNIENYSLFDWFEEYKDNIKDLIEKSDLKVDNNLLTVDKLQKGLQSFMKRVIPKMRIQDSFRIICDDLNQFAMYLWGITNYISWSKSLDTVQHDEKQNQKQHDDSDNIRTMIQTPLQIDFMIIPQCTKNRVGGINQTIDESFYDKDDDDDEEEEHETKNETTLWMGCGGDDSQTKRPIHEMKDIETYLKQCGYKKGRDYIVEEVDNDDDSLYFRRLLNNKFLSMHKDIKVKRYERLIYVIDRRNPDSFGLKSPSYSLNNKYWKDKIYCIKPQQHNKMPKEFEYLPESLFCLSQQLLLPQNKEYNNKIIGAKEDMNGYMFTLSYHICSPKILRSYFGFGGQIQRFCIKDIAKFWPELFVEVNDVKQTLDDKIEEFALTDKYNDDDFDNFFRFIDK